MAKIVFLPALALGVGLVFGLGNCEQYVPVTVSPDSVASGSSGPESEDPESAGRLKDCSPGTADCDRNHANGCEAVLADDPKNCGVCGTDCSSPNAETGCLGGTCRVIHCAPGYCDEDGDSENGCETAAKTCTPKVAAP